MKRLVVSLGLVLAAFHWAASPAQAQTATGQITGTLTDTSGALVIGAKIKISNTLTGLVRETTTSDRGTYSVPLLPVGIYLVTGEQEGFKLAMSSDNELKVDQVLRVDMVMEVGALTESVEVVGRSVAVDSETASIGHVVTERQVTELPLNGRNFLQLLFLGNGAVETNGEQGDMRQGAGNAISINGSRPTSNNFLLDGTSNTDTALGTPAAILSIDAIQEFKEQTATYSAEYGFSANQISIVSKTGTNRLSGSVFSFMRNDKLDARSFFDVQKQKLDQKQFGFVVGGPVLVPGAYNGRNKTFFLVNYEGMRREVGSQDFLNVPRPDELAGRFSSTIIDPVTRQPFPNNTIPQSRFSRVANLALSKNYWPAPNASLPQGNYIRQRDLPTDTNQFTVRIDQQLGSKWGTVFGRYTQSDWTNTTLGTVTELGDVFFVQDTKNWQVSHSVPIGSSLVNQLRVGFVGARANQHGFTAPASRYLGGGIDRRVRQPGRRATDLSGGRVRRDRHGPGRRRQRGERLPGELPADVGSEQHHDVDPRPSHAQLRRELSPLVTPAGPRERFPRTVHLQRILHRKRRRRHAARLLLGGERVPAGGLQRRRTVGQSARVQLPVLRAVSAGRLEGQRPADPEPRAALGLSHDPVRDQRSHGVARPVESARRAAGGGPDAGRSRASSATPATTSSPAGGIPRTRRRTSSRRGWDSRSGRSADSRRSCAAATACSGTRSKAARSTAPRTSIRTSAAATTAKRRIRPRR